MKHPAVSVVIPVGPGDSPDAGFMSMLDDNGDRLETVISATVPRPHSISEKIQWVTGSAGRGRQLNRGAETATGDWLWFVHADCRPQANAADQVLEFVARKQPGLGYGRLRFFSDGPRLTRLNALGAALRSRVLRLPYGDQGLCLAAEWFQRLGGFREDLERGEDVDFVVRARVAGLPIRPMDLTVYTSARRYRDQGWFITTWRHQIASMQLVRNARRNMTNDPS